MCVHSRTLWISPMNAPIRLGVSLTTATPIGLYNQRFLRLSFSALEPWVAWCVLLPSVPLGILIHTQMWDHRPLPCLLGPPVTTVPCVLSTPVACLLPPTSLYECFFFNYVVVGLPYSLIFWQFWVFFVFKFVVVLL